MILGVRQGLFWAFGVLGAAQIWQERAGVWGPRALPQTLERLRDPTVTGERGVPLNAMGFQSHLEPMIVETEFQPEDRLFLGNAAAGRPEEFCQWSDQKRPCVARDTVVGALIMSEAHPTRVGLAI